MTRIKAIALRYRHRNGRAFDEIKRNFIQGLLKLNNHTSKINGFFSEKGGWDTKACPIRYCFFTYFDAFCS